MFLKLDQAKALLAQDPNFKKGFKFDHVWPILKNIEKYADTNSMQPSSHRKRSNCNEESQSDSNKSDKSIGASSFCIDLNADFEREDQFNYNNDATERPVGRNKEKMKKKQNEEMKDFLKYLKDENQQIKGMFEDNSSCMQQNQSLLQTTL